MEWHAVPGVNALSALDSTEHGLDSDEVENRLARYGPNVLPTRKPTPKWQLLTRQLASSLVYLLVAAAAISFVLGEVIDAWVILAAVLLNVVVGYFQESRAQDSLSALQKIVTFETVVRRNGRRSMVAAGDIVPGDILVITAGARIPADARLLETHDLSVNEAALTGESYPVDKGTAVVPPETDAADRSNMVHMGTVTQSGSGTAVVVATGLDTGIGEIASLVSLADEGNTPLQQRLQAFSRTLTFAVVVIAIVLFVAGLAVGMSVGEIFTLAVAVAVAAVPEGLLVAVTAILAVGMNRIAKRKALTKRLLAAETLGSTTVICADKTGTLTEGRMTVASVITNEGVVTAEHHSAADLLRIGVLNNDAVIDTDPATGDPILTGSPTETALLAAGAERGLLRNELEAGYPRIDTEPFDSVRKLMRTLHKTPDGELIVYVKGSPEKLLGLSATYRSGSGPAPITAAVRQQFENAIEKATSSRLRLLAVGQKPTGATQLRDCPDEGIELLGLVAMRDPLRTTATHTVQVCRTAGIRPVMITGDHRETASAIADDLGLDAGEHATVTGSELDEMTNSELAERIEQVSVYARVTPAHKMRIVEVMKQRGHVVAMTGDGVNDAPALKLADVGVALGSGTDVAKEAADIILIDDDFSTIVAAVEEGRVIYDNIRKVVLYLLSDSLSEVILISASLVATAFVAGFPIPILPAQILWVNLVNDGPPYIALTVEPKEPGIMERPPPRQDEALLMREMRWLIGVVSFVSAAVAFAIFTIYWQSTGDVDLARTMVFAALGMDSLVYVLSIRNLRQPIWRINQFENPWLVVGVAAGFLLQVAAIYLEPLQAVLDTVALSAVDWVVIGLHSLVVLAATEITKWALARPAEVRS